MMRIIIAIITTVVVALVMMGCDLASEPVSPDDSNKANLSVSMSLQPAIERGYGVTRVYVRIEDGSFADSMDLTISGSTASGTFTGLEPGTYTINVYIYQGDTVIAAGSGTGVVTPGQTTTATVVLDFTGNLIVEVLWGDSAAYKVAQRSPMPVALQEIYSVYVQSSNKIYLFGGSHAVGESWVLSDKIYVYDVATDVWSQASEVLPYGTIVTSAALGGDGKIYLGPGIGPTFNGGWGSHRRMIEYDPSTGEVLETADFGFTLWGNELVAFQGNVYIFGGWTGSGVNKIWRFAPQTGTLTELPSTLPHAANQISGMLGTDNLIYLFSGHPIQSIQIFDPADNTISLSSATFDNILQDPLVWRNEENRFYCGDYLAGKIYKFTPESHSLEVSTLDLGPEVMKSLYFGTAVTLPDGRVFICGGTYDGAALANVWELIPR